jgi:hypothetical protein
MSWLTHREEKFPISIMSREIIDSRNLTFDSNRSLTVVGIPCENDALMQALENIE